MLKKWIKKAQSYFSSEEEVFNERTPKVYGYEQHRIDQSLISRAAIRLCEELQRAGYEAYIVGGAVRDLMIGARPKDFDVATNATPEQVKKCHRNSHIIGRRFRLVHARFGSEIIECATFRALGSSGVGKDEYGRVISDNVFGEMWEDAARRDFTVNSLYYDPMKDEILDYHGGFEDIQNKTIRIIGNPVERYREDPVRIVRALRIASKLGFSIEPKTKEPIASMVPLLGNVPEARLHDEFVKILVCGNAVECLHAALKWGLMPYLMSPVEEIYANPAVGRFFDVLLSQTDARIRAEKSIGSFFLLAGIFWSLFLLSEDYDGVSPLVVNRRDFARTVAEFVREFPASSAFSVNIKQMAFDTLMLHSKLHRRVGFRAEQVLNHPRFRAAYDFLELRVKAGNADEAVLQWWNDFLDSDEHTRRQMVCDASDAARSEGARKEDGQRKKRRGRHSRRKKTAAQNTES